MKPRALAAVLGLAAALLAGAAAAEPSQDFGISDFGAWKASSPLAHGGQRAEVNGISLYYETYGAGPPVIVLHGGTAFIETMHYPITALAANHLVVAVDSRGHGRSTDGPGPLHYRDMAQDVLALMDRLHIARADLVGWSDGGIIGLDLAIHHPERLGRMVVMGTNYDLTGIDISTPPTPADSPTLAPQRAFYERASPTPAGWATFYAKVVAMWRSEPNYTPAELATIKSPVLVMAGENDSIRRAHTDALAKAIPGAQEAIIPGATHFAPLTHPEAVTERIVAFLGDGEGR